MWSAGVILYALLAGALPFRQDIAHCERYRRFSDCMLSLGRSPSHLRALSEDAECGALGYASDPDDSEASSPNNRTATLSPFAIQPSLLSSRAYSINISSPECKSEGIASRNTGDDLNWFFPESISSTARVLICALLHPEPNQRPTALEAKSFSWCLESDDNDRAVSHASPSASSSTHRDINEPGIVYRPASPSLENDELQIISVSLQKDSNDNSVADLSIDPTLANNGSRGPGRVDSRSPPQSPVHVHSLGLGATATTSSGSGAPRAARKV
jgi:serine/threonine protein kinase